MKRSEINEIIRKGEKFFAKQQFLLPPFAKWSPDEWRKKGRECSDIIRQQLGWDITDFGSGNFHKQGLFLFTVRNGTLDELKKADGKIYAEKIMIVEEQQVTPTHFHFQKMEDIINRGGGNLLIRIWNSTDNGELAETDVVLYLDGVKHTFKAGETIRLAPGESVCLRQRIYHRFWGEKGAGTVLVGEVSRVNDDNIDNRFYDKVGRFPEIEEDEEPLYLLMKDYKKYCNPELFTNK